jgi:ketosteroid isomerase-like protein
MSCRSAVAGAVFGALLPALYGEAVARLFRFNIARVNEGDTRPLFRSYARDVVFTFPGESSWGGTFRGRDAVQEWVGRFMAAGLRLDPNDVVVSGPPWNTRACVRFTDALTLPDGTQPYVNAGVIYARIAWGRLKAYEVHEDTERTVAFDDYLFPSVQDTGPARA